MKLLALLLALTSFSVHADLNKAQAQALILKRQAAMGVAVEKVEVLSIESMTDYNGATLYRVNADLGPGEQTYQIRVPQQSKDGVTDVILTSSIYNQSATAKEFKLTESELARTYQAATDAVADSLAKEFPEIKRTGLMAFVHGERFGEPKAVLVTVQQAYKRMSVPLLRRAYVHRGSLNVEVGYDD